MVGQPAAGWSPAANDPPELAADRRRSRTGAAADAAGGAARAAAPPAGARCAATPVRAGPRDRDGPVGGAVGGARGVRLPTMRCAAPASQVSPRKKISRANFWPVCGCRGARVLVVRQPCGPPALRWRALRWAIAAVSGWCVGRVLRMRALQSVRALQCVGATVSGCCGVRGLRRAGAAVGRHGTVRRAVHVGDREALGAWSTSSCRTRSWSGPRLSGRAKVNGRALAHGGIRTRHHPHSAPPAQRTARTPQGLPPLLANISTGPVPSASMTACTSAAWVSGTWSARPSLRVLRPRAGLHGGVPGRRRASARPHAARSAGRPPPGRRGRSPGRSGFPGPGRPPRSPRPSRSSRGTPPPAG